MATVVNAIQVEDAQATHPQSTHPKRNTEDLLPETITPRELEILRVMAQGIIRCKEIAAIFDISWRTVDRHRSQLMQKLNVHTRAEAVARYQKAGGMTAKSWLTGDEEKVVEQIVGGNERTQIAKNLKIPIETAIRHELQARKKLGASSRIQMAICYIIAKGEVGSEAPLPSNVTSREIVVLQTMTQGETSIKGIAAALGISDRTVSTHQRRLMKKLEVHTCVEAAVRYVRANGKVAKAHIFQP